MKYNFSKVEKKWQDIWDFQKTYQAKENPKKKKYYALFEFPYPSGDGLHVGHIRPYVAMDVIARKRRAEGYNVLFPIGWDAFGLPTENYAIKTGIHPKIVTKKNTDNFRRQFKSVGFSLDWSREINTTDPNYYKWTQWIFLQFFKAGLAYKTKMTINWCPKDKIGLANEEVIGGKCERCGTPVEKKEKEQWMLKITAYADKLLEGLKDVDFLPEIKTQQENWIGRSEGALIKFPISNSQFSIKEIEVFTTRPDTLFGATFIAISVELAKKWIGMGWKTNEKVKKFIDETLKARAAMEKSLSSEALAKEEGEVKEKLGVETGIRAVNPSNKEEIPVWVVNYVLGDVGTGAIMAVPAHDERDFEFAKKYNLEIKKVISPVLATNPIGSAQGAPSEVAIQSECWIGDGQLLNSGKFDGMDSKKAKWEITKAVGGTRTVKYKLRDWVFSRQRYWGEPIPLVFCDVCHRKLEGISNFQFPISKQEGKGYSKGELENPGWVTVSEKDLPVKLPEVKEYKPRDDGESPLASVKTWVNVKCPKCKSPARRETDTMPNWAGSSWYFYRYCDPHNKKEFASRKKLDYWMGQTKVVPRRPAINSGLARDDAGGVDWYNGGMEHVTLHLLYSRFWNLFLFDQGLVPTKEPYQKRTAHGLILGEGGIKMSKSKGNVVNPDTLVKEFGADALRLYEMFIGPFAQSVVWDPRGIVGMSRFLERIWTLADEKKIEKKIKDEALERMIHKAVKKVSEDIETMSFNTAVSALMIFINECTAREAIPLEIWGKFISLLAPFAPHIANELWEKLGNKKQLDSEAWPEWNPRLIIDERVKIAVQVDGKFRDTVEMKKDASQETVLEAARRAPGVEKWLKGKKVVKIIFVPNRLINICLGS